MLMQDIQVLKNIEKKFGGDGQIMEVLEEKFCLCERI